MYPIKRKRRLGAADSAGGEDAVIDVEARRARIEQAHAVGSASNSSTLLVPAVAVVDKESKLLVEETPLPSSFISLIKLFGALNTTYSFLAARKDWQPVRLTYEAAKAAVEQATALKFELEHVRMMCAVAPALLDASYIDADALNDKLEDFASSPAKKSMQQQDIRVLIEFLGNNIVRPSSRSAALTKGNRGRGTYETVFAKSTPLNHKTLQQLIETRNKNFKQAIIRHVEKCELEGLEPVSALLDAAKVYLTENSDSSTPILSDTQKISKLNFTAQLGNIPVPTLNPSEDLLDITMDKVIQLLKNNPAKAQENSNNETSTSTSNGSSSSRNNLKPSALNLVYEDQIAYQETVPARPSTTVKLSDLSTLGISAELAGGLQRFGGITELYSHQAEAIMALCQHKNATVLSEGETQTANLENDESNIVHVDPQRAKHVIVATSTSSGKSLIYQIPLLQTLEQCQNACVFYICPTKALAQDQKRSLTGIVNACPHLAWVKIATYDGDTPADDRARIRKESNVIFTNPDMLHVSIMPACSSTRASSGGSAMQSDWGDFLRNLKYVIVDELHYYHGVFGSHCALIFRRLRRLCEHYNNYTIQFIACSATIANPIEHASNVFGVPTSDFKLIDKDGSPSGQRTYLFWNLPQQISNVVNANSAPLPSQPDTKQLLPVTTKPEQKVETKVVRYGHSQTETAKLFVFFITKHIRTLAFAKYRKACELLFREIVVQLESLDETRHLVERIKAYRSGYHVEERRAIEKGLFTGELLGVVATNALELGVDIGGIEAVLHMGYPGNAAMRQQAGRAGRRQRDAVSVLVADTSPLDQYYMRHPQKLLGTDYDSASIDVQNPYILESHLRCAAFELPVSLERDVNYFGDIQEICQRTLVERPRFSVYETNEEYPSRHVPIRSIDQDTFTVYDTTNARKRVLEEVESHRAAFLLYMGGIFLNQGSSYLVLEVNSDERYAKVRRTNVQWITKCNDLTDIDPVKAYSTKNLQHDLVAEFGEVNFTKTVYGYRKHDSRTHAILEEVEIDTVPISKITKGCWIDVPLDTVRYIESFATRVIYDAIHAVSHALASLLPSMVLSSQKDITTECPNKDRERIRPFRIILIDLHAGGSGASRKAYEHIDRLLERTLDAIEGCLCADGCPQCILWSHCASHNERLSKQFAAVLLRRLLKLPDAKLMLQLPCVPHYIYEDTNASSDPSISQALPDTTAVVTEAAVLNNEIGFDDQDDNDFEAALIGMDG